MRHLKTFEGVFNFLRKKDLTIVEKEMLPLVNRIEKVKSLKDCPYKINFQSGVNKQIDWVLYRSDIANIIEIVFDDVTIAIFKCYYLKMTKSSYLLFIKETDSGEDVKDSVYGLSQSFIESFYQLLEGLKKPVPGYYF